MSQAKTDYSSKASYLTASSVEPLTPMLGAEVKGIDLSLGINEANMTVIRNALHRYSVIVLRDQNLTPSMQVAFGQALGKLRVSLFNQFAPENVPELTVVSNIQKDGKPIGLMDAGALWHTDGSYLSHPDMYTILYSIEIPSKDGQVLGDTKFVSTAAAFDGLSQELKEKLASLSAIHSIETNVERKREHNFNAPPVSEKMRREYPDVQHPVIRSHPITGRKCLFVSEGHTKTISGIPEEEAQSLLKELIQHINNPEFMYTHKWKKRDLLIWDNCATQHLAIADYGTIPRRLHRAGVLGPVPE